MSYPKQNSPSPYVNLSIVRIRNALLQILSYRLHNSQQHVMKRTIRQWIPQHSPVDSPAVSSAGLWLAPVHQPSLTHTTFTCARYCSRNSWTAADSQYKPFLTRLVNHVRFLWYRIGGPCICLFYFLILFCLWATCAGVLGYADHTLTQHLSSS